MGGLALPMTKMAINILGTMSIFSLTCKNKDEPVLGWGKDCQGGCLPVLRVYMTKYLFIVNVKREAPFEWRKLNLRPEGGAEMGSGVSM
jgi:hypothetical protein